MKPVGAAGGVQALPSVAEMPTHARQLTETNARFQHATGRPDNRRVAPPSSPPPLHGLRNDPLSDFDPQEPEALERRCGM